MTIKTIFNKLNIHFMYYLVALISILTGYFKEFIIFSSIILVHELGHLIPALYYKWKIDKIVILPFGGITIFKENLNKPLKQEFIITIMGPLIQIIFYFTYNLIFNYSTLLTNYHYAILFFNLIPIIPLDGSKIINIILNKYLSFKRSHIITIYLSFIFLIFLIISIFALNYNVIYLLIFLFLFLKVYDEKNNHNYIFNKFLFERFIYTFSFKKRKVIEGEKLNKMSRDYKHLFYINNKYHLEKTILHKKFDFK